MVYRPRTVRNQSCHHRLLVFLLLAASAACRSPEVVVEPGAALLRVERADDASAPDELRVWAWDDGGTIWDDVRVPRSGALPAENGREIGTILLHPDAVQGALHVHVRGLALGLRVADGTLAVASLAAGPRIFDIVLAMRSIDDCPVVPGPDQPSCPVTARSDAGPDSEPRPEPPERDAEADGQEPTRDGGSGGATPVGGQSGSAGMSAGPRGSGGASGSSGAGGGSGAMGATGLGGAAGSGAMSGAGGAGDATGMVIPPAPIAFPGPECTTKQTDPRCDGPPSACYKHCGPEHQGYKALSCMGKKYVETDCIFSRNTKYACYSVRSVAACAAKPPTSGTACSVDDCKPCGSATGIGYYDVSNVPQVGYCVCSDGYWSCAGAGSWPCPGRSGC